MKQNKKKITYIPQHDEKDCGAACLSMIADYYGVKMPLTKFRELIKVDNDGASIFGIIDGASKIHLKADALQGSMSEFIEAVNNNEITLPAVAHIITESGFLHYVVIYRIKADKFYICDPDSGYNVYSKEKFEKCFSGNVIDIKPDGDFKPYRQSGHVIKDLVIQLFHKKKIMFLIFLASLVMNVINISSSYIFQYIIDGASEENNADFYTNAYIYGGVVIGLFAVQAVLQYLRNYWSAGISRALDIELFQKTYGSAIKLPVNFFLSRKTGEVMTRFSDAESIRNAVSSIVLSVFMDILMFIFFLIMMIRISILLTVISILIMLVYAVIVYIFKASIKKVNHIVMENNAVVSSFLKESIDGIETIKSNTQEENFRNKNSVIYNKLADSVFKASMVYSKQGTFVGMLSSCGTMLLILLGLYSSQKNLITIGQIMTFYVMFSYFASPVKNLISLQPTIQTALVAADRLDDILETNPENMDVKNQNLEYIESIVLDNVRFQYGNREPVLNGLSIHAEKGKTIALVGESGCGKTTIARLLMRFYDYQEGSVLINGESIDKYSISDIRKKIAYISQETFLFSDTIRNNLTAGAENVSEEEIIRACRISGAGDFISKLPEGLDTILSENSCNLSGGQKQRLAIARALLKKPDVLIMDEATSNLDTISEAAIISMLNEIKKDMTCIVIAHRLKTIRECDTIYFLKNGKIAEQGTHDELMRNSEGMYYKYYSCS